MNRSIEVLKAIYKPYRYTIKGKATKLETTSGDFVIKEKNKNVGELFNYLVSRHFDNFPHLIDESRKDVNVYEYIEGIKMPLDQKCEDMIDLVSQLHNQTSYFKEVSEDKYKEIYEGIKSNITYLRNYYNTKYEMFFTEIYMSPSHYLFMRNFAKVMAALDFAEEELGSWYDLVKEESKIRVCVVHNNLELDHYIKADKDYFISWDNFKIDTPVLDFVNFYRKEYAKCNFEFVLKKYLTNFPLLEYEKKLLFILIALPPQIKKGDSEFATTQNMRKSLDYVFKTENLIRPYYAKDEEEK